MVTFEALNIDELTYDFIVPRLLNEERRLTQQRSTSHKALTANTPASKPKVTCYYCGRLGHIESECRTKVKDSERALIECGKCHERDASCSRK